MTKKALDGAVQGERFEVKVDNDMACGNLMAYLAELQIECSFKDETRSVLLFEKSAHLPNATGPQAVCHVPSSEASSYAVVIKSETMGSGSDELGLMLMRAFINSLKEADRQPSAVILYNGGVHLAAKGRDTAQSLMELEANGVGVVCCGTCVEYFGLKDELAVGAIGNMFLITKILSEQGNIIYP